MYNLFTISKRSMIEGCFAHRMQGVVLSKDGLLAAPDSSPRDGSSENGGNDVNLSSQRTFGSRTGGNGGNRSSGGHLNFNKRRATTLDGLELSDITFRNVALLSGFVSERGKILSIRITNISHKKQMKVAREIKIARYLALMPYPVD